ncbi:MAG: DUF1599 domain-containing protein [Bacteroidia bacterium]|nr:DUF1599 domain-containing protein [Bacteroidia bacterium]MDW8301409.1 DUF1599 domain-containing protein [Bacteroidia bacterium]
MDKTLQQYQEQVIYCKDIFMKKAQDYGNAWQILRLPSLTDQIYIKLLRIRNIEELGNQKIGDSVTSEYRGVFNYCVMALLKIHYPEADFSNLQLLSEKYDEQVQTAIQLMQNKNHDYGEAWRLMRISSITDLCLMKVFRIKSIENQKGKTIISEGVESNYMDIMNYAVFALIRLCELKS